MKFFRKTLRDVVLSRMDNSELAKISTASIWILWQVHDISLIDVVSFCHTRSFLQCMRTANHQMAVILVMAQCLGATKRIYNFGQVRSGRNQLAEIFKNQFYCCYNFAILLLGIS